MLYKQEKINNTKEKNTKENSINKDLPDSLQHPLVYVTRDIERAIGLRPRGNYFIISNNSPLAEEISNENTLLVSGKSLDTWEILKQEKTKRFLNNLNSPNLVVFKNTKQIQRKCDENNWNLLNPKPEIINEVEQKISQVEWLDYLADLMPRFTIETCKNIDFQVKLKELSRDKNKKGFVLQFNRAHTGSGTHFIESEKQLESLQEKFPERPAKITEFISGDVFTLNCIAAKDKTLTSSPSYQITGVEPFTQNNFATIGNDWGLAEKILDSQDKEKIKEMGKRIGTKLRDDNFVGLFGIDVIKSNTGEIFLIEINARQPASTTFETKLQKTNEKSDKITTFSAHLKALLRQKNNSEVQSITNGAQIILRRSKNRDESDKKDQERKKAERIRDKLTKEGFGVIIYDNKASNSELLRIMSNSSICDKPNQFNKRGKKIKEIIKNT
ncbi:MAG: ATP-grasp domain-containing protein [Candidatus Magasanikbacteria bacterium]